MFNVFDFISHSKWVEVFVMVSYKAPNPPAELLSLTRSSVKRSGRTGQRGLLDLGQAAPVPWHCTSHRAQSKTPEAHLLLKYEEERYKKLQGDTNPVVAFIYVIYFKVSKSNPRQLSKAGVVNTTYRKSSVFFICIQYLKSVYYSRLPWLMTFPTWVQGQP